MSIRCWMVLVQEKKESLKPKCALPISLNRYYSKAYVQYEQSNVQKKQFKNELPLKKEKEVFYNYN